VHPEKGKPDENQGRKVMGLRQSGDCDNFVGWRNLQIEQQVATVFVRTMVPQQGLGCQTTERASLSENSSAQSDGSTV